MLDLRFERRLAVPPDLAWSLLAEPTLMNLWSEARITCLEPGDGGHPGGTGALRSVALGQGRTLRELVARSEPGARLVYQVIDTPLVLEHEGVQRVEPDGAGARIEWHVRARLASPALEWAMRRGLERSLGRSLDLLVSVAGRGAHALRPRPLPPPRVLDEAVAVPALLEQARRASSVQAAWADRLLARGDDRGWFGRVYARVTDEIVESVLAGHFEHPAWVLRLVLEFHPMWEDALRQRLGELPGDVPPHWARAHRQAERAHRRARTTYERAVVSMLGGIRAHIEGDLGLAIARVHRAHYAARADLARFRADYYRMAPLFQRAAQRVQQAFPRHEWGLRARLYDRLTPELLRPTLIDRTVYPITRERRAAFRRAEALASG